MARGRPFQRSLQRLVRGGVAKRPPWLSAVEAVPPHFVPVESHRPGRIVYPEDRLREQYLLDHPESRRVPVNLKAQSRAEAHIADRFVSLQMRAMRELGFDEEEAYEYAQHLLHDDPAQHSHVAVDIKTSIAIAPSVEDASTRLYVASLKESKEDQELLQSYLCEQRHDETSVADKRENSAER